MGPPGGATPYGGQTPARVGQTPNPYSSAGGDGGGKTPNPYASGGGGRTPAPGTFGAGGKTPGWAGGGGKTPGPGYGGAGGRTPAPGYGGDGGRTPGWAGAGMGGGRTPMPGGYGGGAGGGGRTPAPGASMYQDPGTAGVSYFVQMRGPELTNVAWKWWTIRADALRCTGHERPGRGGDARCQSLLCPDSLCRSYTVFSAHAILCSYPWSCALRAHPRCERPSTCCAYPVRGTYALRRTVRSVRIGQRL
jgi:hypothetical protein